MTLTAQRAYYRQQHLKRLSLYNYCLVAAKRGLRLQMKPALEAVRRGASTEAVIHTISPDPIEQALLSIYTKVVPVFAQMTYKQILTGGPGPQKNDSGQWQEKKNFFDSLLESQWVARARYYVQTVGSARIRKITETTRDKVRQFLDDAIAEGWSVNRTASELTSYTQQLNKSRSVVIARTELINASNQAAAFAAKSTKLNLDKIWLSAKDSRVRHSHANVNGQRRDIDEPFSVNGYQLMVPADSSLGAPGSEVIQCRCCVMFVPKK